MHVMITGAAGMLGTKLAQGLAASPEFSSRISRLTLVDLQAAPVPTAFHSLVQHVIGDFSDQHAAERLAATRPDLIFHLAAVVSGEAESDFDKGYRINLDGTRHLFEAIRREGALAPYVPKLVFASSIAVFGAPFPEAISDDYLATPLTSYGTQKAICELLLSDYARRGIFDGIGLRLPTICIRPGAPNKAASGFFSAILREPLSGKPAVLPVGDDVRHWFASPRAAIGFLLHAARLDSATIGPRRNLSMPGLSETVAGQIAALERVAGKTVSKLIDRKPDETIRTIVAGWPSRFDARRALALGFKADNSFDAIIRAHIEDEGIAVGS